MVAFLDHGQDGRHGNDVAFMIVHFDAVSDNAFGDVLWFSALLGDFFDHSQLDANGGARVDWFGEAAFVDSVIQQNWALSGLYKQSCRLAQDVVPMGNTAFKHGAVQAGFIHVGVEMIP